jgi:hypothetical protein
MGGYPIKHFLQSLMNPSLQSANANLTSLVTIQEYWATRVPCGWTPWRQDEKEKGRKKSSRCTKYRNSGGGLLNHSLVLSCDGTHHGNNSLVATGESDVLRSFYFEIGERKLGCVDTAQPSSRK